MSVVNVARRTLVTLYIPQPVSLLVALTKAILAAMTGSSTIPSPTPTLADVTAALTALEVAEAAASLRTRGAVAVREEKRLTLVMLLHQLKATVQKAADADPEGAIGIVEGAGMTVRKVGTRRARIFDAVPTRLSGVVMLVAPSAGRRASYEWQVSTDGAKTWLIVPPTLQATTTVPALTPGAWVSFRYRAVTKSGAEDWSQPVTIMVH